jgi:predicted Zn-ribbon and HTH transcriptional regulator
MPSLKRAFELLARQRRPLRLHRIARRVITELSERGLEREAAEVESWLNHASPSAPSMDAPTKRPVLPTHCPSCGAGVRPDEVEWLDDATAECAYCGSPLRGES